LQRPLRGKRVFRWLNALFGLLIVGIVLAPTSLSAQQKLVENITVHGNRRIPAETIKQRMFTKAGDVYDEPALDRDFNSLWNTGYFDDLRFEREDTEKGGVILHVYVKEKPTIREIKYTGLNAVSQSDVLDRFKKAKVGLTVESQFDPTVVKKAEVTIKDLLAEHGRQFATIRTEIHQLPPAAVSIDFVIKEGPKVKVGKITFKGDNLKLKKREIRSAMKNLKPVGIPHSIFLENLFARTFDSSKLDEDAERVRFLYQTKGYDKVLVDNPTTKIRDTGKGFPYIFRKGGGKVVDITLPITPGDQYRLKAITFTGQKAITDARFLRAQFQIKDGDIFDRELIGKGLENLRKAYGGIGYVNFTAVPDVEVDEEHKTISMKVDVDEGKQFYVRRIEFTGNTTTRDKVIRRELAIEEGNVYNSKLWEFSLLRLNQLQYFNELKVDEDSEVKQNQAEGTVDLLLKVKEKGKNSIGLQGGVSGLAGSFIGINYETNNFLGLGETLGISAQTGNLQKSAQFSFTQPYAFDRPLQLGFSVFTSRYDYNAAKNYEVLSGTALNLPQDVLSTLQNFSQSQTGFSLTASYPLKRSLKRVGLSYSYNVTSIQTFSTASQQYFEAINFDGVTGPNSLNGIRTSSVTPSFTFNSIGPNAFQPKTGSSIFVGGEFAGLGGNVNTIRPIVEYKHWRPMNKGRNALGFRLQGSYITGYAGRVAPPYERFYMGGENDLRGFDIRTVTPYIFIANRVNAPLQNPDGTFVPVDPTNPRRGFVTVPVPAESIIYAGGDTSMVSNVEYRIPIAGPVTLALFDDFGLNFISRPSQLKLTDQNIGALNSGPFGCPVLSNFTCVGNRNITFSPDLQPIPGTNFTPRMSTGVEFQVLLPIVKAPFRIYYAYNPLRLNTLVHTPNQITRDMFPPGAAGDYSFQQSLLTYSNAFQLREPRKTFRFTVSTTF
jgi:outer membrane protein insertion porin family